MNTTTPPTNPKSGPSLVTGSRRGKPGRPKNGDVGIFGKPMSGHNVGTVTQEPRTRSGVHDSAAVHQTVVPANPRLLDLSSTSAYLGISTWTVRELENAGVLGRVRIPLPDAGEVRKLLFDRLALDKLIDAWTDAR